MRWSVEVASLSSGSSAQRLTVEAPSWQGALAQVRAGQGDSGPLSNFTIEVMGDGYRATNPFARVRYTVAKAADDAPLTSTESAAAKPGSVPPPAASPATSPAVAGQRAVSPINPDITNRIVTPAAQAAAMLGSRKSGPKSAPRPAVEPTPPRPSAQPVVAAPAVAASPAAPHAPVAPVASPAPPAEPTASASPAQKSAATSPANGEMGVVFFRRAEQPGAHSPLTYREIAVAIEGGSADRALQAAHAQLASVKRELDSENAPPGRLVQLAVFDHEWTGRPARPALITMTWKDWKGPDPQIVYPGARAQSAVSGAAVGSPSISSPTPAVAASAAAPIIASPVAMPIAVAPPPPPPPPPPPEPAPPAPVVAAPPIAPIAPMQPAAPRLDLAGLAAEIAGAVAVANPHAQPAAPAAPPPAPPPQVAGSAEAPVKNPSSRGSIRAPRMGPDGRPSRPDDLMTEIFEQMHDLQFLRDSLEGAEFVLELLRDKVPARVTIIHLYDINSKEFVVVKARAPNPAGVLGTRSKEGSSLVGVAAKQGRGMMVTDAKTDQRWSREYYSAAGYEPQRIMVVPVRHGQRYLGALELADHVDDMAFTDTELHAVSYIAEQFGEFVAERGVTLKPGADSTGGHPVIDVSKRR